MVEDWEKACAGGTVEVCIISISLFLHAFSMGGGVKLFLGLIPRLWKLSPVRRWKLKLS
jgi:hypothetical protein